MIEHVHKNFVSSSLVIQINSDNSFVQLGAFFKFIETL